MHNVIDRFLTCIMVLLFSFFMVLPCYYLVFFYIVPRLMYLGITIVYLMYHDDTVNKYHVFCACIMLILFL